MRQSRFMSLGEAVANVFVGYGAAVVTQLLVFPVAVLIVTISRNLAIGGAYTMVSVVRSDVPRRVFEAIRVRRAA